MLVDCAQIGFGSIAAHGHADCLSFTMNVGELEIFVDAGTYDYFSHPDCRQYFRETKAHNTVVIDGVCQSESLGPFMWGVRANAELREWHDDEYLTRISGLHDGYRRLSDPVIHRRTIETSKSRFAVDIIDELVCRSNHEVAAYFHLAPECQVDVLDRHTVLVSRDNISIYVESSDGVLELQEAAADNGTGWISRAYHVKEPSRCLVVRLDINGTETMRTRISLAN